MADALLACVFCLQFEELKSLGQLKNSRFSVQEWNNIPASRTVRLQRKFHNNTFKVAV
jgi:hypothetical protein